jgi:hypothetical protein
VTLNVIVRRTPSDSTGFARNDCRSFDPIETCPGGDWPFAVVARLTILAGLPPGCFETRLHDLAAFRC